MEVKLLSNGRYYAIGYEVAFAKEDYADAKKSDAKELAKAEDAIEHMRLEDVKKEVFLEFDDWGFTKEDYAQMQFEKIEFQEFDSPRWHGSGYFYYQISAPTEALAKEWAAKFEKGLNS